jgi:hypothetical protein
MLIMVEVNEIYQVQNLDAWHGSNSTGGGLGMPRRRKKKDESENKPAPVNEENSKGVSEDDSGRVHIDLTA